ncbi:unnamed protein product, partial [marine sediment metagenome]
MGVSLGGVVQWRVWIGICDPVILRTGVGARHPG